VGEFDESGGVTVLDMITMEALPEIPQPNWVDTDSLCWHISGAGRPIWAEGYQDGRVAVILDNPGARETSTGDPFICGTRQTLLEVALEAGIQRHDLYVTFLLKCQPHRKYDHYAAWTAGIPVLIQQLRTVRPKVLVCMGNTVVQALFAADAEVKAMRGQLWEYDGAPVVVTYHPLAVRRRPTLRRIFAADLQRVTAYLH
jgi:DNA polymerase